MKFADILDKIKPVPFLAITGDSSLQEASDRAMQMPQIRGIYVVEATERLVGYVSLGHLIHHVVTGRHRSHFHIRSLLSIITAHTVADIMERKVLFAKPEDELAAVLDKMLIRNIKQVPIVNAEQQIIVTAGILDIWKWIQQ